jgi:hypothetical protein
MKTCTACKIFDHCTALCLEAKNIIGQNCKSQRELSGGIIAELVPTTGAFQYSPGGWREYEFLRPIENEVLFLSRVESLSYAEIAKLVDRKPNTIKSMVYRSKKKIRHAYLFPYSEDT